MSSRLITPAPPTPRFEIRCDVGDAIVANLATHFVFFFERRLDPVALANAFARALQKFPIFAGRMATVNGRMRIRDAGRGVPFSTVSSPRTLADAIRSASEDDGLWLVDPVNGATSRWGLGALCRVRITHLAGDATVIGFSWHHAIGDMHTFTLFLRAWSAAAAGVPVDDPLIVENRSAYLNEVLPESGAREPGVRCLSLPELARSALYLAKDSRRQRTLSVYFGNDEISRMQRAYGDGVRLSANDVVCAHVSETLMEADPTVDRRTLAIAVNARKRCHLDPMLVGNVITTLGVEVHRGEPAGAIATRIRDHVDRFATDYCDLRINQRFLDGQGAWRAARCVSTVFNPARWNPLVTNLGGFGVYRIGFEGTPPAYYTMVLTLPVAGLGALLEGAEGRGLMFLMSLPPNEFAVLSSPTVRAHLQRFRRADDDIPRLHRVLHG